LEYLNKYFLKVIWVYVNDSMIFKVIIVDILIIIIFILFNDYLWVK
jgi:hypothetical protein